MIIAAGFTPVIARMVDALNPAPDGVPVHLPPMDQQPIGLPSILIGFPEIREHVKAGCGDPHWSYSMDITVIAESPVGLRLAGICDAVTSTLDAAGYKVTASTLSTYEPPESPAPIPAVRFTVE